MDQDELGLDLLMNPKKKASSDSMSIISSRSGRSRSPRAEVIDVKNYGNFSSHETEESASEYTEDDVASSEGSIQKTFRKPQKQVSETSFTEQSESEDMESLAEAVHRRPKVSEEDILNEKRECLYQFDRMEKKGMKLPRKFTLASSLDDMKQELERLRRDRQVDASIKFQRKTMITVVSGIELLNSYFDPINAKLDGWSENINENIDDYDDVFEELHEKYKGKAKLAPELKLLFMLGGSAFMFHMTNSMFKTQMPGLDQVLKQNPELAKQFAAATASTMQQNTSSPLMGGLGGMFSSMFGGGGGGNPLAGLFGGGGGAPPQPSAPISRPAMKGPSNVEDILKEIETGNDRVEMLSTVTESELSELGDDVSINNLLLNKKGSKRGGKKITLDI